MSFSEPYDDRLMGELAALADGSLRGPRRAELEARVAADPELAAALDEQRRAVSLIRGAAARVEAPAELREQIAAGGSRAAARHTARRRSRWAPSLAFAGIGAAALAVVAVALSGGPTVEAAAAFASLPATGAAPAPRGAVLDVSHDRVAFPAWAEARGWRATGIHRGEVDGRPATAVHYAKAGRTLAYAIVSGDALEAPEGARVLTAAGTRVALFDAEGRRAATWVRDGRTCVLTGDGAGDAELAALAGWRGGGAVAF